MKALRLPESIKRLMAFAIVISRDFFDTFVTRTAQCRNFRLFLFTDCCRDFSLLENDRFLIKSLWYFVWSRIGSGVHDFVSVWTAVESNVTDNVKITPCLRFNFSLHYYVILSLYAEVCACIYSMC